MGAMAGCQPSLFHEPYHTLVADMHTFIAQLSMDAWAAITPLVLLINVCDLLAQFAIFSLPG
jgi:hypothetical protein